jgi:AraC-like DNA-binding protein
MKLAPNIVQRTCNAGIVEHAWLPALRDDAYISFSNPYGICLAFTGHRGCVVSMAGGTLHRDLEPGGIWINGPEPIRWHLVREPSDVVEITATPEVRCAVAEEMGVAQVIEMDDLRGATDDVAWAIAARIRATLRSEPDGSEQDIERLIWHLYRRVFELRRGGRLSAKGDGRLDRRRLERARADILKGASPIDVARRYGFNHIRHFDRLYRRHHGLGPSDDLTSVLAKAAVRDEHPRSGLVSAMFE